MRAKHTGPPSNSIRVVEGLEPDEEPEPLASLGAAPHHEVPRTHGLRHQVRPLEDGDYRVVLRYPSQEVD